MANATCTLNSDGYWVPNDSFSDGSMVLESSSPKHGWAAFGLSAIPQGATINSADLTLDYGSDNDLNASAKAVDGDDVSAPSSYGDLDGYSWTDASASATIYSSGSYMGFDVTSVLQELVNRANWPGTSNGVVLGIFSDSGSGTVNVSAVGLSISYTAVTHYSLSVEGGSYSLSGQAATPAVARKLSATGGSLALTGQTAGLKRGLKVAAASGARTLTGQAATLRAARKLSAASGARTLTGQAATLSRGRRLSAAAGSLTETGQVAGLKRGLKLAAAAGSLALTGQVAGLKRGLKLAAAAGSGTLTGQDAALRRGYALAAAHGEFTETGAAVGFLRTAVAAAAAGEFQATGQGAAMFKGIGMMAESGAVVFTGQAANLVVPPTFLAAWAMQTNTHIGLGA